MSRRDHSPIPPPREPRRDAERLGETGRRDDRPMRPMRPHDPYARDRRRPRSMSPTDRYGRKGSPPPGYNKRHRRDDEYPTHRYDRGGSPHRRGSSPGYDRAYEQPYGQPPPPSRPRNVPKTFKEFILGVEGDLSPEEAQLEYDRYLANHFGSELRASFERNKQKDITKEQFDPRAFEAALVHREEQARAAAEEMRGLIQEGSYDPSLPNFNQGTLEEEGEEQGPAAATPVAPAAGEAAPPAPPPPVSPLLWTRERVAADWILARRLMVVLDHERGITDNPLLPELADIKPAPAQAQEGAAANGAEEGPPAEGTAAAPGAAAASATANGEEGAVEDDPYLAAALCAVCGEQVVLGSDEELDARLGQLDIALTWLWRVHGVDFYGGRELLKRADYDTRLTKRRTLRGPKPEEGEQQDEAEVVRDKERLAKAVDERWEKRLQEGDPLLRGCQRKEIEDRVEAWVEAQVKKENDKKWGSTLSNKFFLDKKFVLKHIRNKHHEKVVEARDKIIEELFWAAFQKHHEAKRSRAVVEKKRQAAAAAARAAEGGLLAPAAPGSGGMPPEGFEEYVEEGYAEGHEGYEARGGRGFGRGRGRGGRGRGGPPRALVEGAAGAMVDPTTGTMLMPAGMGPMGPIFIPVPAGATPLAPMMAGASQALGMGPMEVDMSGMVPMMPMVGGGRGGRGGRPMRGRGGGRFGGMAPPGTKLDPGGYREYYDLDNPRNNRAVLDYGDI